MSDRRDFTGERFGELTVISLLENGRCLCRCDCGEMKECRRSDLGRSVRSCGCLAKRKLIERNKTRTKSRAKRDITGQVYGALTAVRYLGIPVSKWECRCQCGKTHRVKLGDLKRGHALSCGCLRWKKYTPPATAPRARVRYAPAVPMHSRTIDLTGQRYGRLVAVHFVGDQSWFCSCDCGKTTIAPGRKLRAGHTMSCGCARYEAVSAASKRRWSLWRDSGRVRPMRLRSSYRVDRYLWEIVCLCWNSSCAYCEQPAAAFSIDHVQALALGGRHQLGNLVPACGTCNNTKRDAPLGVALERLGSRDFHRRRLAAMLRIQEMLHA